MVRAVVLLVALVVGAPAPAHAQSDAKPLLDVRVQGDTKVTSRTSATVGGPGVELIGISPHAHMIAKHLNSSARIGGKMECLSDVHDWDFEWQLDYIFAEPIPISTPISIAAFCDYDNGPDNQPTVDGVKRQQPITVYPGEGSADEMCLHYVWVRSPVR